MTNAETQLAGYFAKYEPAMAKLGMALRAKLRVSIPISCIVTVGPHCSLWKGASRSAWFLLSRPETARRCPAAVGAEEQEGGEPLPIFRRWCGRLPDGVRHGVSQPAFVTFCETTGFRARENPAHTQVKPGKRNQRALVSCLRLPANTVAEAADDDPHDR